MAISYGTITITDLGSVTAVDVYYYVSTSATQLKGGSWSTNAPTWSENKYIWSKTVTTWEQGNTTESNPACITGAKGSTGSKGDKGDTGAKGDTGLTGRSVQSIVEQYYLSTSSTTQTGGSWGTSMPTYVSGRYYWTRSVITWKEANGSTTTENTTAVLAGAITSANSVANTANSTANTANSTANQANSTANTANSTANTANATANEAKTIATTANTTAGNALTVANGKNTIYYQNTQPSGGTYKDGDSWYDTDGGNALYIYNGSTKKWVKQEFGSGAIKDLAITNAKIANGTIQSAKIVSLEGAKIVANSITSGQLATDAIKSNNYVASPNTSSPYSAIGTFLNLADGNIYTPNFGVDSVNGGAYINGQIVATSGQIGDSEDDYWQIGTLNDYNMNPSAAIIGHGTSYIQSGTWQISNDRINTQTYDSNRDITYMHYNSKYWDYGMQVPELDTAASGYISGVSNNWLYIRRSKSDSIPALETDWDYLFKVDKDGTIYENGTKLSEKYASITDVGSVYLPKTGGTISGNLTVTGSISGTASKANALTHTLSINGKSWTGSANLDVGTIGVAYGGTGKTTGKDAANYFLNSLETGSSTPVDKDYYISQYVNGGTSTTTYHRRPMSALWLYIKSKIAADGVYMPKSGGTFTGAVNVADSFYADSATLGDLIVNGGASFTNNLQANTINGVTVGSNPKFTDTVTTITTSGSGNAITSITASNGALTAKKEAVFLTSHQTVTNKSATLAWNSAVTIATIGGTNITAKLPANPNTNTTYTIATGDSNGQIKVTPSSGSAYNVSVKGLGSNAYSSTSYLPLAGGTMSGSILIDSVNGIKLRSQNQDLKIWEVTSSDWSSTYGFHELYKGTGSGNDNALELYAHNQNGTHVKVRTIKQDGTTTWHTTQTFTNIIEGDISGNAATATTASSVAWGNVTGKPNRAGSDSDGGPAQTVKGAYTGSGGQKNPNYFGKNKVGFLMMSTTVNSNSQYKDWIIMDCYNGSDVGGGVAFGVNRQSLGAYIMRSAAERTSWAESAELLGTHNYNSYVPKLDGTGATGTWGISVSGNAATATAFSAKKSVTLTGDVTGTASSTGGWSLATTITDGVVTNAKLANSSITIGGSSVSLGGSIGTIVGPLSISTQASSSKAFVIQRTGASESVSHWVDDSAYHIDYKNDESSSSIKINISNTDTEGSDGTNASSYTYTLSHNGTITAKAFDGNASSATKATKDSDGNTINTTYIKKSTFTAAYQLMYSTAASTPAVLSPNTTTTRKFLRMTGTGSAGAAPAWDTVTKTDVGLSNVINVKQVTGIGQGENGKIRVFKGTGDNDYEDIAVEIVATESSSVASAQKLSSYGGSATQPVYFPNQGANAGKPVAISYTIEKSVPSNAVFTDTWKKVSTSQDGYISKLSGTTTTFLRGDGTWGTPTGTYSLPLAASGTRGGIQIGYSSSGKNYAVQLSSEKAYVNVPWTDTTYSAGTGISLSGTTFSNSGVTGIKGNNETDYRTGQVNITKSNIGLGSVENKSSATIRGEITSSNVTTALGYTPTHTISLGRHQDFERCVIALCETSAANTELDSWSNGVLTRQRNNGLVATKIAYVTFSACHSVAYSAFYSLLCNHDNTSTEARSGDGFRACTFTYNSKTYAGLEFYQTQASYFNYNRLAGTFTPFMVCYYNASSKNVINTEINDSLSYDSSVLFRQSFNAQKVNNHTVNSDVPSNALFTDHTYNFSGVTFYSGNKDTAEHNANNAIKNGNYYYTSNGPATSLGASTNDGALYVQSYNDSWVGQIAQDYRNGRLFVRGKNNGTWKSWMTVLDSGNYNSYSPKLDGTGATGTWGVDISGNATTATTASKISNLTSTDNASSTDTWRKVWISYNDNATGRPAVTTGLTFQTSTNTLKATTFSGALNGNALTATTATNDSDGNKISTTYLKKSGGTMTGGITLSQDSSAWNTKGIVFSGGSRIGENTSNRLGIYSGGVIYLRPDSSTASSGDGIEISGSSLYPSNNNSETLGDSSHKWSNVYATTFTGALSGNASSATSANITTTANAVAYYSNTTGKFASKASANGVLYATSANGALSWGTLPIAQGGTGATTAANAVNNILSGLPVWSAVATDSTYFIRQDTAGGAAYGKVPFSTLWSYIKGKGDSTYVTLSTTQTVTGRKTFSDLADVTFKPSSGSNSCTVNYNSDLDALVFSFA